MKQKQVVPKRRYTAAFREDAIKQVVQGGRSPTQVARSLEVPVKTLANWVGRARRGERLVERSAASVDETQAELSRLRAENVRLKIEKEILKKAAAYFAKESL
jgi:transposase